VITKTFITNKHYPDSSKGFSLVEMLVVVLVISMMALASGNYFNGTLKNLQMRSAVRSLMMTCKHAKLRAITDSTTCKLAIDEVERKYAPIIKVRTESETAQPGDEVILKNQYLGSTELPGSVEFELVMVMPRSEVIEDDQEESEYQYIKFYPDGTADVAVLQLGDGKRSMTVSVWPATARVTVSEGPMDNLLPQTIDLDAENDFEI
jgi:prepilin-type N-terminal cleavage/methylation domain-containing protein